MMFQDFLLAEHTTGIDRFLLYRGQCRGTLVELNSTYLALGPSIINYGGELDDKH